MSTTQTYTVAGMTCGHCVAAVTEEIDMLAGVSGVAIELVPGGESLVAVTSQRELDADQVRAAVDEAGYELTGTAG